MTPMYVSSFSSSISQLSSRCTIRGTASRTTCCASARKAVAIKEPRNTFTNALARLFKIDGDAGGVGGSARSGSERVGGNLLLAIVIHGLGGVGGGGRAKICNSRTGMYRISDIGWYTYNFFWPLNHHVYCISMVLCHMSTRNSS